MPFPQVSVVMAVYNGERSVRKTIESVLSQTYRDFEFVIINDCSTDGTVDVIQSYPDSRIVISTNTTNIGQTRSLNLGLTHSRGTYIARTDAGDISLPKRFETQVAYLEAHVEVAVVGTGAIRYDPRGRVIDVVHMPDDTIGMQQKSIIMGPLLHISTMMRKGIILQVGGYCPDYDISADFELWSKLLQRGFRLSNIPEVLAGYEVSMDSFGSIHRNNKVLTEASQIIRSNVDAFARRSISLKQAEDIYKFFMLDMDMLSRDEMGSTARLYREVMSALAMSRRDIHYHLLRKYAKYIARHLHNPGWRDLLYIFRSVLEKSDGFFSGSGIVNDLSRKWQGALWRRNTKIWNH